MTKVLYILLFCGLTGLSLLLLKPRAMEKTQAELGIVSGIAPTIVQEEHKTSVIRPQMDWNATIKDMANQYDAAVAIMHDDFSQAKRDFESHFSTAFP